MKLPLFGYHSRITAYRLVSELILVGRPSGNWTERLEALEDDCYNRRFARIPARIFCKAFENGRKYCATRLTVLPNDKHAIFAAASKTREAADYIEQLTGLLRGPRVEVGTTTTHPFPRGDPSDRRRTLSRSRREEVACSATAHDVHCCQLLRGRFEQTDGAYSRHTGCFDSEDTCAGTDAWLGDCTAHSSDVR